MIRRSRDQVRTGKLICGRIPMDDVASIERLRWTIQRRLNREDSYYWLEVMYPDFDIVGGRNLEALNHRGWYIVLGNGVPVYVGRAGILEGGEVGSGTLHTRLKGQGSRDNYGSPNRQSNTARQFVKRSPFPRD